MESEGKGLEHERKRIESQKQERIKNNPEKKTSPYLISLFKVFQNSAVRIFFHSLVANNQPLYNLLA